MLDGKSEMEIDFNIFFVGLFLDRGSRLCSVISKQRRNVCKHNKVGFASCQAFGNSKLLSTGKSSSNMSI